MANLSVDVEIKNLKGVQQSLEDYRKRAEKNLRRAIRQQTRELQNNAKLGAPEDTGNLMASIKTDFREIQNLYAEVYSVLEYAAAQEYGVSETVEVSAHRRTQTHVFGRELESPKIVEVSSHRRQMDIPGQYYMTMAARVQKPRFKKAIIAALFRARK